MNETPLYVEYALAVEGVEEIVTLKWFTTANAQATPFLTEQFRFRLTDRAVTPDVIFQRVKDRAGEIRHGLRSHVAIQERFAAGQNTRIPAP